jgi:rhamnosyltransferase
MRGEIAAMNKIKTAAGLVAFRPDPTLFLPLARRLEDEVDQLFVFVNGVIDDETLTALRGTRARLIESVYNLGVAEAHNQLVLHAIWAGCARLAIFDQDSGPQEGAVAALGQTMKALQAAGERPAVVGPRIVSPAEAPHAYRAPRYFRSGEANHGSARSVFYVISSGSLLDLSAFREVGRFRSDFFIDAIDIEWCFRARARGFTCWTDVDVTMEHRVGTGVTRANLAGRGFPKQPPMRLFAYIRNQTYCMRLAHLPLWWRCLVVAHLVRLCAAHWLEADERRAMRGMIQDAVSAGLRAHLGPPPLAERAATLPSS